MNVWTRPLLKPVFLHLSRDEKIQRDMKLNWYHNVHRGRDKIHFYSHLIVYFHLKFVSFKVTNAILLAQKSSSTFHTRDINEFALFKCEWLIKEIRNQITHSKTETRCSPMATFLSPSFSLWQIWGEWRNNNNNYSFNENGTPYLHRPFAPCNDSTLVSK